MVVHKRFVTLLITALTLIAGSACGSGSSSEDHHENLLPGYSKVALELEKSLFDFIIDPWYPRILDTLYGGYISDFNRDWGLTKSSQHKALVQQARHLWSTSFIYEFYSDRKEFLDYATHGFSFLRDQMWDKKYGGFHPFCARNGVPHPESIDEKRIYGQAFALYGLSQYHRISHNPEAVNLAKEAFLWMEEHAYDQDYGGYFEYLKRDGTPAQRDSDDKTSLDDFPAKGLKDYNSSIHLMEAFTGLYRIWPDSLVRTRLEEMFYLIRDRFVHPDGYLQLYFYPDWTLVPDKTMEQLSGGNQWFTQHFTYGHDVETAYLLLETAHILGWGEDDKTHRIAKRLVDHSLESGWDKKAGGFYDAGKEIDGEIRIINNHKSWWSQVEGLNALLLMHTLYPDDPNDYYGKFLKSWKHIDTYLIDKEFGGWYNHGLDTFPESKTERKSHAWKTTYHNVRGMVNCVRMLKGESDHSPSE
ncbi:MAG: AGE family epimerase/isomerase [Bacteroidota bacterium]